MFSRYAATLALIGSALAVQAQTVTLRFNPPIGKTYVYATTTIIKSTGGQAGSMNQSMTVLTKALKNTGGKITLQSSIEGAKITGTGPGATNAAAMEKRLNGQKTTTVVDSQGQPVGSDAGKMMQKMMQGGLSNMHFFPTHPVSVGSKWGNTMDLAKMMPAQANMKITGGKMPVNMVLKKIEMRNGRRVAVIDMTMSTVMGMTGANPGQSMKITLKSTGTTWIDVASGMPVESRSVANTATSFGTMQMNQNITSTMKLRG